MDAIWDDPDIGDVIVRSGPQPDLLLGDLVDPDQQRMLDFIELDQQVAPGVSADLIVEACAAGIRTVELMPDDLETTNSRGWKKFLTYLTSHNARILWDSHQDPRASAVGGWVLESLGRLDVGPDGFATALGARYSDTMAIPRSSTRRDPQTGEFVVRGGDDGRRLAGL